MKWTSVTNLINSYFPEFDREAVALKCSQGVNPKYAGRDPKDIIAEWEKKAEEAAKKGNKIHKLIENYLAKPEIEPCSEDAHILVFLNKLLEEYALVSAEEKIKHEDWQIVGVADVILRHRKTGKLLFGDWKTNEKIDKYNKFSKGLGALSHLQDCKLVKYSLQLNLYKALFQHKYNVEDCELKLFHIKKHSVEPIDVKDMEKEIGYILYERGVL